MVFEDLREFVEYAERSSRLARIREQVDPDLELTHIMSEELRIGKRRTLLFENVKARRCLPLETYSPHRMS